MKPSEFKISVESEVLNWSLQTSKDIYQITQIEDFNEDCVKISRPYLLYFPRNKLSKSVTVGSVLKVLELFECRRGDPYITANRNFVCFAHS